MLAHALIFGEDVSLSFLTGTSNPWLRLTTANTVNRPNPIIDVTQSLWFDLYTDKALQVGLDVRETNPTGNYGDNGGTTGTIEFVGVPEARIPLAHATAYMCRAKKSREAYDALGAATEEIESEQTERVPGRLKNEHFPVNPG